MGREGPGAGGVTRRKHSRGPTRLKPRSPEQVLAEAEDIVRHEAPEDIPKLAQLHPRRFFLETWRRMDEEAEAERVVRARQGKGYDFRPMIALAMGAAFLALMEYFGNGTPLSDLAKHFGEGSVWWTIEYDPSYGARYGGLFYWGWWAGWRVLGYFLLPCVVIWLTGGRVRDQGVETKGFIKHAWIYLLAYAVVLVCVVTVSFTKDFSSYYPFYKNATRSWFDFGTWELMYAAQFFSLEFFFRGWWLKSCKSMMGSHAIFAMIVPYCMIHFGKPFPEVLGAILAGIFLGTLAMKTRSIWSGFLIHVSVAVSMDVAALLQTTGLPHHFWPGT